MNKIPVKGIPSFLPPSSNLEFIDIKYRIGYHILVVLNILCNLHLIHKSLINGCDAMFTCFSSYIIQPNCPSVVQSPSTRRSS